MATSQSDYTTTTINEGNGADWTYYVPQEPEQRRFSFIGLVTGLILGTLFGWFVLGWLLFPVQYEGGHPNQLTADSRADYISSVADSYVARQDALALELARYRLRAFIGADEGEAALIEARDYFNQTYGINDPAVYPFPVDFNSRARTTNIDILANDLGFPLPPLNAGAAGVPADTAAAVTEVTPSEQSTSVQSEPATSDDSGANWLRWLLTLLLALGLIGAALYLLRKVFDRNDEIEGDVMVEQNDEDGYIQPASQVVQSSTTTTTIRESSSDGSVGAFHDEYDEEYDDRYNAAFAADNLDNWEADVHAGQRTYTDVDDDRVTGFDDDFVDEHDAFIEGQYRPVEHRPSDADQGAEAPRTLHTTVDANEHADYAFAPDDIDVEVSGDAQTADVHIDVTVSTQRSSATETDASPPLSVASASSRAKPTPRSVSGTLLDKKDFHYHAATGGSDYDESITLRNERGDTIGSYGLGVNLRHGTVKSDPDQVIALDAWLFDKVDDRNPGDYRRILISEYVVDHELEEQYVKDERVIGRPIVAQSGMKFNIDSGQLLLHCEIQDATYDKDGVFVNVEMTMQVLLKD